MEAECCYGSSSPVASLVLGASISLQLALDEITSYEERIRTQKNPEGGEPGRAVDRPADAPTPLFR
jgi:hypothetical protein